MVEPMAMWGWLLLAVAATFVWRFAGVVVSGRISESGPLFAWIAAVAYAMVAGLMARVILMPRGDISFDTVWPRALPLLMAFALWRLRGKSLGWGLIGGVGCYAILVWLGF